MENILAVPQTVKFRVIVWSVDFTCKYLIKNENICPHKYWDINVCNSMIDDSQEVETAQIDWWMDKKMWCIQTM